MLRQIVAAAKPLQAERGNENRGKLGLSAGKNAELEKNIECSRKSPS